MKTIKEVLDFVRGKIEFCSGMKDELPAIKVALIALQGVEDFIIQYPEEKPVEIEGWVNVYENEIGYVFPTKDEADGDKDRVVVTV